MEPQEEILALIPHRPPFLWVDKIVSCADNRIVTEKHFAKDLELFQGHYPGFPVMPGVLLCETVFQSSALLIAKMNCEANEQLSKIPVITRIGSAKFKKMIYPGDTVLIEVRLVETIASAYYFKGKLKCAGETALNIDFACKMVGSSE